MKTDPILAEIRAVRDAHAKRFNYDLAAICEDNRQFALELGRQEPRVPRQKTRRIAVKRLKS
jgi:hypothetical protein